MAQSDFSPSATAESKIDTPKATLPPCPQLPGGAYPCVCLGCAVGVSSGRPCRRSNFVCAVGWLDSVVVWDEDVLAGGEWVEGHSALVDEREGWGAIRVEPHGKCPSVVNGDSIANWFARNWYDVVGSGEVKHYRAGTSVQTLGSKRGAFAYAAKKYVAKTGECVWSAKPGRFWGIVGRKNLPLGRRDVLELTNGQALKLRRVMRRYRMATCAKEKRAKMRKGQLFSRDFTVKLFAGVEFWMERIPALLGSAPRLRQAGARRLFPLLI